MQYEKKDIQPIITYLDAQDHGIKKKLAKFIKVGPQQLSFYLRYYNMPVKRYNRMLEFINNK